jgi:hypothetical protein
MSADERVEMKRQETGYIVTATVQIRTYSDDPADAVELAHWVLRNLPDAISGPIAGLTYVVHEDGMDAPCEYVLRDHDDDDD